VANLTTIREPEALPGWLKTTTQRECLTLLRDKRRQIPRDQERATNETEPGVDASLLVKERRNAVRNAVREAVAQLRERDQELLLMLFLTRRCPTRKSALFSLCRLARSDRPGSAAWPGCAEFP
jgi:DNA-directed RNA polymerase specialized sigma24 family protein